MGEQMKDALEEKRFTLKGATLLALISALIGIVVSSMTVYADIDRRITGGETRNATQDDRLLRIEAELVAYRKIDGRLATIEANLGWIKQFMKAGQVGGNE